MNFTVTYAAMRPASDAEICFYCRVPVGGEHKDDCVLVSKKVRVIARIEYEIDVPAHWTKGMIEFHRNDGSWCSDNMLDELEKLSNDNSTGCLCNFVEFEYIADTSEPYLSEK